MILQRNDVKKFLFAEIKRQMDAITGLKRGGPTQSGRA
jgi:hypothetical protein